MAIATGSRSRSIARRLMLVSALVVALSLAFTGAASAQTSFQATVKAIGTLPGTQGSCPNGAFACGTADIAGYGAASWNFYVTSVTIVPSSCGSSYTATTEFTLVSDPGSTLVLDESGTLCAPGNEGAGFFQESPTAYGHPFTIVGSWTVDPTSTGQFFGLTGSGSDLLNSAGAIVAGSYSGTLG